MNPELLKASYDAGGVALSVLVAAFASYVALDLARRVRSSDRASARAWTVGGALVMGSGIWSMHFVGMLALTLPIEIGYQPFTTFLSWAAAVAVSAIALLIAARDRLAPATLAGGGLAMGAGICVMHYTGMAAIELAPGIVWDWRLVAASAAIACAASTAALIIFFLMRRLAGLRARLAQLGAAVVMGAAISGMHYTAMAAADFPVGALCLSVEGLGGRSLGTLIVLATVVLLSITLFTSVLDARMQARAQSLTRSLQTANEQLQGANAQLQRMAFVDPLTGVANRALFENRLAHALARVDRLGTQPGHPPPPSRLAILFIDLDGFKPVNDSYGHDTGDHVLRQVAERLKMVSRDVDTVARVGGDEFVLLLEDIGGLHDAVSAAGRILQAMGRPFELAERKLSLSCSIGIAAYPEHGQRDKLMAAADAAMYAAKRSGSGGYAVFESHMNDGVGEQIELQQALREALQAGQLKLHYQPKVDSRSGCVCGIEALLRWTHPTRGPISPAVFIPIAERFGLIIAIGNWVIDEACRQMALWSELGLRMRVSINVSAYQLRQPDMVDRVQQALYRHGVDADQLVCEITESVAMEDTMATQRVIEQLGDLGVKLSIDDFGTGYSSLSSLRQIGAQELKIDRSFVKDVATNADARAVVDAVVRLGHALGLRVVAEGVENRLQRETLLELGCDEFQGFYLARPMAPDALLQADLRMSEGSEALQFSPSTMMPLRAG
ncbi:EAL domain-containing protein [Aquincola sp. S2]|uniref:EAL domain-containing protein n=1 Tax=Pseudaquabacterium terrae TaxID=2732868 RepID=A0ABX2EAA6_9BURK|nr:EAL domain-containing protein [Aquabacterium terrae]NRF65989.1 EAL domain-containing protein [Aquabacterium terrae]